MSDAGIIAIVSGYITLAGAIVWLALGRVSDNKANAATLQAMDDERDKAVQENASLKYERDALKAKVVELAADLQLLAQEEHADPNADVGPRDYRELMRRAAAQAAAAAGSAVPASTEGALHPEGAAGGTAAAEVHVDSEGIRPDGLMQP